MGAGSKLKIAGFGKPCHKEQAKLSSSASSYVLFTFKNLTAV
jgi:hypothetical protein